MVGTVGCYKVAWLVQLVAIRWMAGTVGCLGCIAGTVGCLLSLPSFWGQ